MPNHGMTITKITQSVLLPPPRSLLRKMSPRTQNRHMNHAKNRKNSNKATRNEPLSLNMGQPPKRAEGVAPTGFMTKPCARSGRRHPPHCMRRRPRGSERDPSAGPHRGHDAVGLQPPVGEVARRATAM